jgi:squalene-hopene/tetraprenyl-beta-curcumene cyclase
MNRTVDENPVRVAVQELQPPTMQPKFGRIDASLDQVDEAVEASKHHIFQMQKPDGHWVGELEADGMLEADYIFLHVLLETYDPKVRGRMQRALTEMLRYQNEDGSWSIYPGGPGNISLAVKCYFACKLMGVSAKEPLMVNARTWIRAHGGVVKCNTFTKIYLCALGQYDYDAVPAIPPEIVLVPK